MQFAASILKMDYAVAKSLYKAKDVKVTNARQTGKVMNFGTPGGLGAKTLVAFAKSGYGVVITEEEARALKKEWFETYPEMRKYFDKISRMSVQDPFGEMLHSVEQVVTKRLRGDCFYTAACNSFFQGLGADATKAAGFLIAKECYVDRSSPLFGSRIVNYIHDEFILECLEENCDAVARRLPRAMEEGASPFLPGVPPVVDEVTVSRLWSKNAKKVEVDGKIVPWDMVYRAGSAVA